jgi:phospholipid/cholesterol/gamma-HCH transport system permease protein
MSVVVRADREGDRGRLIPTGHFDLAHATTAARAIASAESTLDGCHAVEIDLSEVSDMDGAGAVQLARLIDRLEVPRSGPRVLVSILGERHPEALRLIDLYRERRTGAPAAARRPLAPLARLGSVAAEWSSALHGTLDFAGRSFVAFPRAVMAPRSVDWHSLPRLVQDIGADGLLVASAANLLVGVIIGFLGVSQLGRFGATVYVPELVVVAHFRELGPLVTAIVVAGRSGAGLASEIATMKVSEEIDALRAMGFNPVSWLVVPRCLALVLVMPVLTWVGDVLALIGGLAATTTITDMSTRAYVMGTSDAITAGHFLVGLVKSPFLALAIGLIACRQGLATRGGAAEVGARTTTAVVMSILGVIVISALFTILFAFVGV